MDLVNITCEKVHKLGCETITQRGAESQKRIGLLNPRPSAENAWYGAGRSPAPEECKMQRTARMLSLLLPGVASAPIIARDDEKPFRMKRAENSQVLRKAQETSRAW